MTATGNNTLEYDPALCTRCGMCAVVCPHGVFENGDGLARLADRGSCMECGACAKNCPEGAIRVDSGVGCATAMILAALTGRKQPACKCGPGCG